MMKNIPPLNMEKYTSLKCIGIRMISLFNNIKIHLFFIGTMCISTVLYAETLTTGGAMNNQHGHLQREHFVNGLSEFKGPGLSRGILIGRNSRMAIDSKENIYVLGHGLFKILPSGAVSRHYTNIPGGLEALSIDREDNLYLSQYHSQEYRSPSGGSEYSIFPFLQPSPEKSYFNIYKLSAQEKITK
ncbi:MAG TPA: hypothetical protein VN030_01910, partial [Cellvibrio sp.]|nr:hypothetical protein [Cellvibrio sp.]